MKEEIIEAEFSEVIPEVIEAEYVETTELSTTKKEVIEATLVGNEEIIGGYNVVSEEEHIKNSSDNIVFESKLDPNPVVRHDSEPIGKIVLAIILFFTLLLII